MGDLHWIGDAAPSTGRLLVRVRHGPELVPAFVRWNGGGEVVLDEPDEGIAPGQFAVFYRGPRCLGSGRILAG